MRLPQPPTPTTASAKIISKTWRKRQPEELPGVGLGGCSNYESQTKQTNVLSSLFNHAYCPVQFMADLLNRRDKPAERHFRRRRFSSPTADRLGFNLNLATYMTTVQIGVPILSAYAISMKIYLAAGGDRFALSLIPYPQVWHPSFEASCLFLLALLRNIRKSVSGRNLLYEEFGRTCVMLSLD